MDARRPLDLHLPSGLVRSYSLHGDPRERGAYRIAVLNAPDGRGGSAEVHRIAAPGVAVRASAPRNAFALEQASHYLFLAGGIGVTPLLAMAREVSRRGRSGRLSTAAEAGITWRSSTSCPRFLAEELHVIPRMRRACDFGGVAALPSRRGGVLLRALRDAGRGRCHRRADQARRDPCPAGALHGAACSADLSEDQGFEVELARSGITDVPWRLASSTPCGRRFPAR